MLLLLGSPLHVSKRVICFCSTVGKFSALTGFNAVVVRHCTVPSAGNHAQGVALSAKKLNVKAVIVMPLATPMIKVKDSVVGGGAEVVDVGDGGGGGGVGVDSSIGGGYDYYRRWHYRDISSSKVLSNERDGVLSSFSLSRSAPF